MRISDWNSDVCASYLLEVSREEFARLTTDDIESFSIMKDATATALYGARGANGVIIVKPKEGREGKANISFRVENSMSAPTKNIDLADPITFMLLHNKYLATREKYVRASWRKRRGR